jgi:glyoxylase-like metal-dependent hydrolase (beta-lactamase superfamily II)
MASLEYRVHVHPPIPQNVTEIDPDDTPRIWSPISTTLIMGQDDLVVVDPGLTYEHAKTVGDVVADSGKRLAAIYATHGHGDHWFASGPLLERFPGVPVYGTPGTIEVMHQNADPAFRGPRYDQLFPGQNPESPVRAVPIPADGIELDGEYLVPVEVGHTDTDKTTVLHVPSIGLVVAGDAVYNNVHIYLLETVNGGMEAWLAALDKIDALHAAAVVAGHKDESRPDAPETVAETRQYLLDAQELLATCGNARGFYDAMLARHPGRINVGALWRQAIGMLPR